MWGGRPRPRRTPGSGLAKPVKRRPTRASTGLQGTAPHWTSRNLRYRTLERKFLNHRRPRFEIAIPEPLRPHHEIGDSRPTKPLSPIGHFLKISFLIMIVRRLLGDSFILQRSLIRPHDNATFRPGFQTPIFSRAAYSVEDKFEIRRHRDPHHRFAACPPRKGSSPPPDRSRRRTQPG
jgi:hypothetical protein